MTTTRNQCLDAARGIGILAVIVGHIGCAGIGQFVYTFHLPLFFMISGLLFRYQPNIIRFIVKKCKSYLIPYCCCAVIIAAYISDLQIDIFIDSILKFLFQRRYTVLWFLSTLFLSNIIFEVICKFCKQRITSILLSSTAIGTIFILYDEFIGYPLPWNLDTAFIAIIFIAVGYWLKVTSIFSAIEQWKSMSQVLLAMAAFCLNIACSLINNMLCDRPFEMWGSSYGIFPLTIIAACTGSLGVIVISFFLQKRKMLTWLGRNTMAFFAFHQSIAIPIVNNIWNRYVSMDFYIPIEFLYEVIELVGVLLICYIMHIALIKARLGFVIGK